MKPIKQLRQFNRETKPKPFLYRQRNQETTRNKETWPRPISLNQTKMVKKHWNSEIISVLGCIHQKQSSRISNINPKETEENSINYITKEKRTLMMKTRKKNDKNWKIKSLMLN